MNRIEIIPVSTAVSILKTSRKTILITENLSGHRIQWLNLLALRLKNRVNDLMVFSLRDVIDKSRYGNIKYPIKICDDFDSKNELIRFLKNYSKFHNVIVWDGDNWLIALVRFHLNCRILIMRPYIENSNLITFLRSSIKLLICNILINSRTIEVAYLRVPMERKVFSRIYAVDDELDISSEIQNSRFAKIKRGNNGGRLIILPGFITSRKNPIFAIHSIEKAMKSTLQLIEFKFLGTLDRSQKLQREINKRNWIKLENSYINRLYFLEQIANADLVILPYSNRASSAIALESMSVGTRVLMAQSRLWRKLQKENPNLLYMAPIKIEKFSERIAEILSKEENHTKAGEFFSYQTRQRAIDYLIHGRELLNG